MKVWISHSEKENIRLTLRNDISRCKKAIEAWANVERVHKKDGGDFSKLSNNFTNCKGGIKNHHDSLFVRLGSHGEDEISLWIDSENRYMTGDEIESAIKDRVKSLNERISVKTSLLDKLPNIYDVINGHLDKIMEDANKEDKDVQQVYSKIMNNLLANS